MNPTPDTPPSVPTPAVAHVTALDRDKHAQLKFAPSNRFAFSADLVLIPIMLAEWAHMARQCPIAFLPQAGQAPLAVALVGQPGGKNLWLDRRGRWTGPYVPAFLRRYPFALAQTGDDQFTLCIDAECKGFNDKHGEALFDPEGGPTPLVQGALQMLGELQRQHTATLAFAARLQAAGVLIDALAEARLADGRHASLQGVQVVDTALLQALPADDVLAWFGNGDLERVHAHLLSLGHLPELVRRQPADSRPTTH